MDYPFTTDGCSGGMSWAWRVIFRHPPPWEDLCIEHDRAYWAGGTKQQRRAADVAVTEGVKARGYPIWAWLMWGAIRFGGHPVWPLPWRWGYGWRWPKHLFY